MPSMNIQQRISFASTKSKFEYPDFLEVQIKAFKEFFQLGTSPEDRKNEGLYKVFQENFPISDTRNNFVLEFIDYQVDPPRYSIEECIERGLTFSVPLKAKLKLFCTDPEHEDFDTVSSGCLFGYSSLHDPNGFFCNQWCRKGGISQLHPVSGSILRTECACQRYKTVFGPGYSFQGILD